MTRTVSLLLLAALGLAPLAACKKHQGPDVAFLLSTLQEERYQKDVKYFEQRAGELGLHTITLAADNDNAKQIAQVEDALNQGAKVLVIQPTDSQAASSYVRLAHEHGAKVVAYDRAIVSPDLDFYVSHDSYKVGVLQAQAAIAATGGKGKYVLLAGQAGHSVATEITRGYKDTLAPYSAVTIVHEGHDANALGAVDAVLATSSRLARAAVAAAGSTQVFIAGADADAENVNLVCQGKQAIEVLKDVEPLARTAAETAKQLLDGATPAAGSSIALAGKSVPVAAVRVEVVTPDNVKPLLVDTGFLSADELPACKNRLAAVRYR